MKEVAYKRKITTSCQPKMMSCQDQGQPMSDLTNKQQLPCHRSEIINSLDIPIGNVKQSMQNRKQAALNMYSLLTAFD